MKYQMPVERTYQHILGNSVEYGFQCLLPMRVMEYRRAFRGRRWRYDLNRSV